MSRRSPAFRPGWRAASGLLLSALLFFPAPAHAQTGPGRFAAAYLPAGHWAIAAARRLDALGLAPMGYDWGQRSLTFREAGQIFSAAAARAELERPRLAPLARGYQALLATEFGAAAPRPGLRRTGGSSLAGYTRADGRLLTGSGYENNDWSGPAPAGDVASALLEVSGSLVAVPHLAVGFTAAADEDDVRFAEGYAAAVWRNSAFWAGRRKIGYGPGIGGGLVLNGSVGLDGGGFSLVDPVHLPRPFGFLGPMRLESTLARLERNGRIGRPWFWTLRGAARPHPRFGLGLSRAIMFGGAGNTEIGPLEFIYMAFGGHAGEESEADNHVLSFDFWYRLPIPGLEPVAWVEWGLDDSAGAWTELPAFVYGLEVPAVPGLPGLAVGLERTTVPRRCCGHSIWYRHWQFRDGWADGGSALAHPLGGHGDEWLLFARADLAEARVRLVGRFFARERGDENLFAPDRLGESTGGELQAELRPTPRWEIVLRAGLENGEADWEESNALLGLRILF